MEALDVGETGWAFKLEVALPVDALSRRRDLDVDYDVFENSVGEDFLQVVGPCEGVLVAGSELVVVEEDGEHVVAGGHLDDSRKRRKDGKNID